MKRYIVFLLLVMIAAGCVAPLRPVLASTDELTPDWLGTTNPSIGSAESLPDNQQPVTSGYDCATITYRPGFYNEGTPHTGCAYETSLGLVVEHQNILVNGPKGTLLIDYQGGKGFILPSPPGKTDVIAYNPSSIAAGSYIKIEPYEPEALKQVTYWGWPMQYDYVYAPSTVQPLKDSSGKSGLFRPETIAYSANGLWMVVATEDGGIALYNTTTWSPKVISWDLSPKRFNRGLLYTNLAVTDDGKYVAANVDVGGSSPQPTLRVYDTSTCKDQSANTYDTANECEYKDIWNGLYRGKSTGGALKDQIDIEFPRRIRFVSDTELQFDGVHDRVDAQHFKVSRYTVSIGQSVHEPHINLLGMGDSYISGEGEYEYLYDTDTANNKCHNSWLSYPIVTGRKYFPQVRSVACSGAKIEDIDAGLQRDGYVDSDLRLSYEGQVRDQITWQKRVSKDEIMKNFMPGYANQILFSNQYQPEVTLLSIGGNDIHFADIIKQCVGPQNADTCYATYEDRFELMESINQQYDKLVALYKEVAAGTAGAVYVIGYPQIADPDGKCGDNVLLNTDEVQFSADLIRYFDSVIKRAADTAGVYYVDTQKALNGYRLCEATSGHAAMNGFTTGNDSGVGSSKLHFYFIGQESYHPTPLGHHLLGIFIAAKTHNFTAPMPTPAAFHEPTIDTSDPLLANLPKANRTTNMIIWRDFNRSSPLISGSTYLFKPSSSSLATGVSYTLTLHSTPTVLSQGVANGKGITVTIPADTPSGFHTLDLYGKNASGQSVDERQVVYIGTLDDLQKPCLGMPLSGNDENGNGIDDTCDAGYFDPSLVPDEGDAPPDQPTLPVEEGQTDEGASDTNDILLALEPVGTTSPESGSESPTSQPASSPHSPSQPPVVAKANPAAQLFASQPTTPIFGSSSDNSAVTNILGRATHRPASSQDAGQTHATKWLVGILLVGACLLTALGRGWIYRKIYK